METITCECGAKTISKRLPYEVYGVKIGEYRTMVCGKCGRKYYDESVALEIEKKEQELGLWGIESETKVGKVGDSLDIRINKRLAEFLRLKKGQKVRVLPQSRSSILVELD